MTTTDQLLALVDTDDGREVRRVRLDRDAQQELSAMLREQARELVAEGLEVLDYDPGYTPDEEVFRVPGFPLPGYLEEALTAADALADLDTADAEEHRVRALLLAELPRDPASSTLLFQNFDSGQVLERRWSLVQDGRVFRRAERTTLVVGRRVTAVMVGGDLYFRSEHLVRRYLDVDRLFAEATDQDVAAFLAQPQLAAPELEGVLAMADRWVRRKVTSILRRGVLAEVPVAEIRRVGAEYDVAVEVVTTGGAERIAVPAARRELKRLLRLLDEDLLLSTLTGHRFEVNSKRRLKQRQ